MFTHPTTSPVNLQLHKSSTSSLYTSDGLWLCHPTWYSNCRFQLRDPQLQPNVPLISQGPRNSSRCSRNRRYFHISTWKENRFVSRPNIRSCRYPGRKSLRKQQKIVNVPKTLSNLTRNTHSIHYQSTKGNAKPKSNYPLKYGAWIAVPTDL